MVPAVRLEALLALSAFPDVVVTSVEDAGIEVPLTVVVAGRAEGTEAQLAVPDAVMPVAN